MNKSIYLSIFCCLLLWPALLVAQSEAEFGKVSKSWTLKSDGSQEFRCSKELTLFTHTAMNSTYGETFIVYNPAYQELKIHESYTKQKDGTIIRTPDNAFVEVLPRQADNAPAFNHLKEMVVVHTGLDLGSTIYLDYSIVTKPGFSPELDLLESVQETSPVKVCTLTLSVPESKPLAYQLAGSAVKAVESLQGGQKQVQWSLRNLPALSREANTPHDKSNTVQLVASTYGSSAAVLEAMKQGWRENVDYEAKAFAQYVTEECTTDQAKVDLLQNYLATRVATAPVPESWLGYQSRDVDVALRSAYATVAEKTLLFNAMLNAVGVPAEVVAAFPACLQEAACGRQAIDAYYIKAQVDGQTRYLSATQTGLLPMQWRGALDRLLTLSGTAVSADPQPKVVEEQKKVDASKLEAVGGVYVCTLPAATQGAERLNPLNSQRVEPFELPSLLKETVSYEVTQPSGARLLTQSGETRVKKAFGEVATTVTPKGDKVEVVRTLQLNQLQYTPAEYKELRQLLNVWNNPNQRVLLFAQ
ncbi:MAG: DUF3857 domain-containing protein [Parabacteroides sp.]